MDGLVYRLLITCLITISILVPMVNAEPSIVDPMRPPNASYIDVNSNSNERKGWSVSEILISPVRRIAVVNDRIEKVGSIVNGAKVVAIKGNLVELNVSGKTIRIAPVTRDIKRVGKK